MCFPSKSVEKTTILVDSSVRCAAITVVFW